MLSQLSQAAKVVGVKQSKKAIRDGNAQTVFVADDAEQRVIRPIRELCSESLAKSAARLDNHGAAAGIDAGAAVVTIVKEAN